MKSTIMQEIQGEIDDKKGLEIELNQNQSK